VGKLWKLTSNYKILFTLPLIPSHQGRGNLIAPSPLFSKQSPLPLWERVRVRGIKRGKG